jgi:hypothetical protein
MKKLYLFLLLLFLPLTLNADCGGMGPGPGLGSFAPAAPTNYLLDANICGAWSFENNLNDLTANGNVLSGAINLTYSTTTCVKLGTYSASFSGGGVSRLDNNLSAGFPGKSTGSSSALSVVGWFNLGSATSGKYLTGYSMGGSGIVWALQTSSTSRLVIFMDAASGQETFTGSTALQTNTDYFFAATWDGTTVNLYIGTNSSSPTSDMTPTARSAVIPAGLADLCYFYIGTLSTFTTDSVAVFKRGLSAVEVTEIWTHGINGSL